LSGVFLIFKDDVLPPPVEEPPAAPAVDELILFTALDIGPLKAPVVPEFIRP
jgi:hypothetical protein